ncbi:MAG: ParB N-terminal domain-containing protein [Gammaproteobacteria bacterium]|nr:ParB N-terminal domain-containing protein [Gammaproteobacteria bacterium]MBT4075435.1 ParB N-terminal domain-containing protein [Gammaproteobacteria bacterium]MBT4196825.1 ParB N-terminal domain-containing protein [Gammaproteobacteria bacterium]MBT4450459.1 ParB N-terminal domain-containing protein [Gammaproteobacteria bacterium]MBT4862628.1 ParB N-terminal domain-containing protein [Gammaproteobacteria bacterium]
MPALVRKVENDPNFEYEVIYGARRHWAISWLR